MSSEGTSRLPPGLALAWGVLPERRRGPRPTRALSEVVDAAMRLADAHGLAGLSMPRVAAEIGLTQNALYRYVASKDELLVLLGDAGYPAAPELPPGWRAAAATWTRSLIDGYLAKPWLLDLPVRGAPRTPGPLRWMEALLQVLSDTSLGARDQMRLATTLDGYARSTASFARSLATGDDPDVLSEEVAEFLAPRLREGGFPIAASLLVSGGYDDAEGLGEPDVEFGLNRILDGVEAMLDGRASPSD